MKDRLQNDIDLLRAELSKLDGTEGFDEKFQALNAAIDQLQNDADLDQRNQ